MNGFFISQLLLQFPDEIKQLGIHFSRDTGAPVAHRPVEFFQSSGEIFAIALEGDGGGFFQMDLVKGQCAFITRRISAVWLQQQA